jgi:hypothetical protein
MCFPLWTFVSSMVSAFCHRQESQKKTHQNSAHAGTSATVACILQFVKGVRVSLAFRYPKT